MIKEFFKNENNYKLVVGTKTFGVNEEVEKDKIARDKETLKACLDAVKYGDLKLNKVEIEVENVEVSSEPIKLDKNVEKQEDVYVYKPVEVSEPDKKDIELVRSHYKTVEKEVKGIHSKNTLERILEVAKEHGSETVVKIIEKRINEVK